MRTSRLAIVFAIIACGPAAASGGFSCRIDDDVLAVDLESGFSHGLGDALLNFRGTATIRDPFIPAGLRSLSLDPSHLPHHWLHAAELKLRIYAETGKGPFASADLVIETQATDADDPDYTGTYRLVLYRAEPPSGSDEQRIEKTGNAACSVG